MIEIRSRHAKPRGHDPARAGRQGRPAHPRHRPGAVDHPAPGHADQPQLHPVSDQRVRAPAQIMNLSYQQDRAADLLKQVDRDHQDDRHPATAARAATGQRRRHRTNRPRRSTTPSPRSIDLRDKIANFDDFFRPLRSYFYWETHCFDIPVCCGIAIGLRRPRRHRRARRPVRQ